MIGTPHKDMDRAATRQRCPNTIGMIYEVRKTPDDLRSGHGRARVREGDFILCVAHTGDCHYTWARLEEGKGNEWTRYFNVVHVYEAYSVHEEWAVLTQALTAGDIVSALVQSLAERSSQGQWGILIDRPVDERERLLDKPCGVCGRSGPRPRPPAIVSERSITDGPLIA